MIKSPNRRKVLADFKLKDSDVKYRVWLTHKQYLVFKTIDCIDYCQIVPYTESTAIEHARLWAALEVSGKMIGFYDLIVAATALEGGSAVATFNTRHFSQVRGLKVIELK